MQNKPTISRDTAIKQVVAQLTGPTPLDEFVKQVLSIWPSKAKNPANAVRQALRDYQAGQSIIFLTDQMVAPIGLALRGVRFRINLDPAEVSQGEISIYPNFSYFLPQEVKPELVNFVDAAGQPIRTRVVRHQQIKQSVFGSHTYEQTMFDLAEWFIEQQVQNGDHILVTIEDWADHRFCLAHEPAQIYQQHQAEIEQANHALADLLFDVLETARNERIWAKEAILTAYTRLLRPDSYPADHWLKVIQQDKRMTWNGTDIRYADARSLFDDFLDEEFEPEGEEAEIPLSDEQARPVYLFKAAFKYNEGLWRRIEIQGQHTLADFNFELVSAFNHDGDHMGGFWKLAPRGKSNRFREIDLGSVDPFGDGDGADVFIGELELEPGSQLKYVYDFGDWIEHRLTLESITEPQAGVEYPRIVEQNKPRYRYCRHCKAEGRQTIATWICLECSDNKEEVLVCQDCLDAYHEEHYANEILY